MIPAFLSTLSLRRATSTQMLAKLSEQYFYPRSPCGERLCIRHELAALVAISIHALLAESDGTQSRSSTDHPYFYPRSPCGERPDVNDWTRYHSDFYPRSPCGERPYSTALSGYLRTFLSTLSLRRATGKGQSSRTGIGISIHALLAESDAGKHAQQPTQQDFYPRSPCGERLFAAGR